MISSEKYNPHIFYRVLPNKIESYTFCAIRAPIINYYDLYKLDD